MINHITTNYNKTNIVSVGDNSIIINDDCLLYDKYLNKDFFLGKNILFFLDPPFELQLPKQLFIEQLFDFFQCDLSLFLMTSERNIIQYAHHNLDYFNIFFAVDTVVAKMISSRQPMCQCDFIAKFSKTKNSIFNNKKDCFTTLIKCCKLRKRNKTGFAHAKRLELPFQIFEHYTNENTIIVDFFVGAGSSLIAAELLNIPFVGFEIDKEHIDITRLELARKCNEYHLPIKANILIQNNFNKIEINDAFDF